MIDNSYIKGYLAALRTIQNGINVVNEKVENDFRNGDLTEEEKRISDEHMDGMLNFIEDQRESYKELVEKLNEQNNA